LIWHHKPVKRKHQFGVHIFFKYIFQDIDLDFHYSRHKSVTAKLIALEINCFRVRKLFSLYFMKYPRYREMFQRKVSELK